MDPKSDIRFRKAESEVSPPLAIHSDYYGAESKSHWSAGIGAGDFGLGKNSQAGGDAGAPGWNGNCWPQIKIEIPTGRL